MRPPARVLDAGCGWGVTLAMLERRGYRAVGLDVSQRTLAQLDRERPGRELIEADLSRPIPAAVEPFDAVLALDVIEHLDDDRAVVERLGRLARPSGGLVVVSVPARPELFSEFDRIQGHRRRYDPRACMQPSPTLAWSWIGSSGGVPGWSRSSSAAAPGHARPLPRRRPKRTVAT